MENVVFWLKQILNLKLYVFRFSSVCQPRKAQAFTYKILSVAVQLFIHHECLEKLKQRYGAREQILADSVNNVSFSTLGGSGRRLKIHVLIR